MKQIILITIISILSSVSFAGECRILKKSLKGLEAHIDFIKESSSAQPSIESLVVSLEDQGMSGSYHFPKVIYGAADSIDDMSYKISASGVTSSLLKLGRVKVMSEDCAKSTEKLSSVDRMKNWTLGGR